MVTVIVALMLRLIVDTDSGLCKTADKARVGIRLIAVIVCVSEWIAVRYIFSTISATITLTLDADKMTVAVVVFEIAFVAVDTAPTVADNTFNNAFVLVIAVDTDTRLEIDL